MPYVIILTSIYNVLKKGNASEAINNLKLLHI